MNTKLLYIAPRGDVFDMVNNAFFLQSFSVAIIDEVILEEIEDQGEL